MTVLRVSGVIAMTFLLFFGCATSESAMLSSYNAEEDTEWQTIKSKAASNASGSPTDIISTIETSSRNREPLVYVYNIYRRDSDDRQLDMIQEERKIRQMLDLRQWGLYESIDRFSSDLMINATVARDTSVVRHTHPQIIRHDLIYHFRLIELNRSIIIAENTFISQRYQNRAEPGSVTVESWR